MEQPKEVPLGSIRKISKLEGASLPMPLNMQVCALGFAIRLKEAGVAQKSYFKWAKSNYSGEYSVVTDDYQELAKLHELHDEPGARSYYDHIAAYTVGELGLLMPDRWRTIKVGTKWAHGKHGRGEKIWGMFDSEADARAAAVLQRLEKALTEGLVHLTVE